MENKGVLTYEDRVKALYDLRIMLYKIPESKEYIEYEWGRVYKEKVTGYIDLFRYDYKIISKAQLTWHLYAIMYMNPDLEDSKLEQVISYLLNPKMGFILENVSKGITPEDLKEELKSYYLDDEPNSKARKIIFYSNCRLSVSEKLSLVGQHAGKGKRITEEVIYEAMIMIHYDYNELITVSKLAKMLKCTTRTIFRNMSEQLNEEKNILNEEHNEEI